MTMCRATPSHQRGCPKEPMVITAGERPPARFRGRKASGGHARASCAGRATSPCRCVSTYCDCSVAQTSLKRCETLQVRSGPGRRTYIAYPWTNVRTRQAVRLNRHPFSTLGQNNSSLQCPADVDRQATIAKRFYTASITSKVKRLFKR